MPDTLMTNTITLTLNGQTLRVPNGCTLAQLLEQRALPPAGVATAVNGAFVPREQRRRTVLQAGDTVLSFEAIVGG
jgi:sulfur carrier protein